MKEKMKGGFVQLELTEQEEIHDVDGRQNLKYENQRRNRDKNCTSGVQIW